MITKQQAYNHIDAALMKAEIENTNGNTIKVSRLHLKAFRTYFDRMDKALVNISEELRKDGVL